MYRPTIKSYISLKEFLHIKDIAGETEKQLWEKVSKYIPPLRFIPGILFVGVGNSLSMNACHKNSDIDLFIITKKNRLWTVRVIATLYFTLLGQRKTIDKHAGKFCLSFFITENALNFGNFKIENDIYLYYWIVFLKPIININKTYEKFIEANNSWANFEEYQDILSKNQRKIIYQKRENKKNSLTGDFFEKTLKLLFLPKTKKSFQKLGKPFGVIISDDVLKFHTHDKRIIIRDHIEL